MNGHVMSKYEADYQKFCSFCGEKTYSACPHCGSPIRGLKELDFVFVGQRPYSRPNYCYECGKPYPWTEKVLESAVELISLDDDLDTKSRQLIKDAIPALLVDTPATPVSVAKYQKGIARAGEVLKNSLYNLLIDVISETAKKLLFP